MRRKDGRATAHLYLLGMAVLLFAWPNVLALSLLSVRLIWIVTSALLLILSTAPLRRSLPRMSTKESWRNLPWGGIVLLAWPALLMALTTPITAFSGEYLIAVLGLTATHRILAVATWPLILALGLALGLGLWKWWSIFASVTLTTALFSTFLLIAIVTAIAIPDVMGSRYPPLVHILELGAGLLTAGASWSYRLPTILWTTMGTAVIWSMAPWGALAKWAASVALLTTPLGWFYHVTLFQVPGELTLALLAIFLTKEILENDDVAGRSSALGMTGSVWFLYRETALAPLGTLVLSLLLARKYGAVRTVLSLLLPVIVAWFLLFLPTSDYVTELYTLPKLVDRQSHFLEAALLTLRAVPTHLTPWGAIVILGSSLWLSVRGDRHTRLLLILTWALTLANIASHIVVALPEFAGYGRFSAFLLLPLSIVTGLVVESSKRRSLTATLIIVVLLATTPWDIVRFANTHTLPHGAGPEGRTVHLYTRFIDIVESHLKSVNTMVIVGPEFGALDLSIADGTMTPGQRSALLARSRSWTIGQPGSPVIIHKGAGFTDDPTVATQERNRRRLLATWAKAQPGVREVELWGQTTYVVP